MGFGKFVSDYAHEVLEHVARGCLWRVLTTADAGWRWCSRTFKPSRCWGVQAFGFRNSLPIFSAIVFGGLCVSWELSKEKKRMSQQIKNSQS